MPIAQRGNHHENILHYTHPGDCADSAGKNEGDQQDDGDCHRGDAADAPEACNRDDDADSGDLQLQVGDRRDDADQTHQSRTNTGWRSGPRKNQNWSAVRACARNPISAAG